MTAAAEPEHVNRSCACCEAADWTIRWTEFVVCNVCGTMTTRRQYTVEELAAHYGHEYFHGSEYVNYSADARIHRKSLEGHLARMRRFVAPGARVLEIGCAYGYFLDLIQNDYAAPVGIDLSRAAVADARARGLDARCGDLTTLCVGERFDAVCLWDTIEHMSLPREVLARAAMLLRPGGHLLLTTGDFGSLVARVQGASWRQIHPPTHLYYFTRRGIAALCERIGLDVIGFETVAVYRGIGSALEGFKIRYPQSVTERIADAVLRRLPASIRDRAFPLNVGDTMFVTATRR